MLTASSLLVSPAASAEEEDAGVFEEIVVTAKKRSESIYEVPAAITAFSGFNSDRCFIYELHKNTSCINKIYGDFIILTIYPQCLLCKFYIQNWVSRSIKYPFLKDKLFEFNQ